MGELTLAEYYTLNFELFTAHNYRLAELENMYPYERDLYVDLLVQYLAKQEQEKAEQNG